MTTTNPIPCPHCHKELLRVGPLAPGILAKERGPELLVDRDGHFMTCPACHRRVDFDVSSVPGSGARLSVRR